MINGASPDENNRSAEPETFFPEVVITSDGVRFPSLHFRALKLESGELHDVSELAREAGFVWPVAVTKALWEDIAAVPPAYSHEDTTGRLWDVLHMARAAIKQASAGPELLYNLVLHTAENEGLYTVRLVVGPGDMNEPVITLSSAIKDRHIELGEVVLTEGALDAFATARVSPAAFLLRHSQGDWGEVDRRDWKANDQALRDDLRLVSAYTLAKTGVRVWVITEWDRSLTTLLLPSEY